MTAHLVEIIILKEVVSEPPFPIGDANMWQLNLKDGVLAGGHSNIAELPDNAYMLWEWMGGQKSDLSRSSENYHCEVLFISKTLMVNLSLHLLVNVWFHKNEC